MKISSKINWGGKDYPVIYEDLDSFNEIVEYNQIYGVCFVGDRIVICYNKSLGFWVLPGGTPEGSETIQGALEREIMEEAGLELLKHIPIGIQKVYGDNKIRTQLRAVCVCKKTKEHNDPCGDISEIKLINIEDIEQYIAWGEIGKHIFERALELKKNMKICSDCH